MVSCFMMHHMKVVMLFIMMANLNLFFYFENPWAKSVCALLGIASLVYAWKLGRVEDAKKKVEQDNRLAQIQEVRAIIPDSDVKSQHRNHYQRIIAWLYERSNQP